jgi:hypothetical protein
MECQVGKEKSGVPHPTKESNMKNSQEQLAEAIIDAAHILANNRATTPQGSSMGGLELHGMTIAKSNDGIAQSIDGLAAQFQEMAFQLGRIADVVEGQKNA